MTRRRTTSEESETGRPLMFTFDRVSTRLIGAAAIAALVVGTGVGADAATKKKKHKPIIRVSKIAYQGGCGIDLAVAAATPGTCVLGGSYVLALKPGEKY